MTVRTVVMGELSPEQRRVHRVEHILRRDGGSPGSALEGLAAIIEDETWRKVPRSASDPTPFSSFSKFVTASPAGLHTTVDQILALLRLRHPGEGNLAMRERMDAMRATVRQLLSEEVEPARAVGRPDGTTNVRATNIRASDTTDYVLARLKRDDPNLAERVVRGELTANAAARQAGIRKPRIVLTSPESIAAALRRNLGAEDLAELVRLLSEA